jgi:hypothetical protein
MMVVTKRMENKKTQSTGQKIPSCVEGCVLEDYALHVNKTIICSPHNSENTKISEMYQLEN